MKTLKDLIEEKIQSIEKHYVGTLLSSCDDYENILEDMAGMITKACKEMGESIMVEESIFSGWGEDSVLVKEGYNVCKEQLQKNIRNFLGNGNSK